MEAEETRDAPPFFVLLQLKAHWETEVGERNVRAGDQQLTS